jgi:CRISPR/Cas system-associated endoribonuclease Cas2
MKTEFEKLVEEIHRVIDQDLDAVGVIDLAEQLGLKPESLDYYNKESGFYQE